MTIEQFSLLFVLWVIASLAGFGVGFAAGTVAIRLLRFLRYAARSLHLDRGVML